MSQNKEPVPTKIDFHKKSRELEIEYDTGESYSLSTEFLRVYSPSAEVRGHGPGEEKLQVGKETVTIDDIEPVGNYAIKLVFSDKHDSGLYSWDLLYDYGKNKDKMWTDYLNKLEKSGYERKLDS